jgi:hypothetical protein
MAFDLQVEEVVVRQGRHHQQVAHEQVSAQEPPDSPGPRHPVDRVCPRERQRVLYETHVDELSRTPSLTHSAKQPMIHRLPTLSLARNNPCVCLCSALTIERNKLTNLQNGFIFVAWNMMPRQLNNPQLQSIVHSCLSRRDQAQQEIIV